MIRLRKRLITLGGVLVALIVLVVGNTLGLAQDATPTGAMATHPAHIHSGTCTELDDVVYSLGNVVAIDSTGTDSGGTPVAAASPAGTASAGGVETSFTEVDASLDDLVAGGYAINVHEAEANIGTYIACGDIGGTITPDPASGGRQLVIALRVRVLRRRAAAGSGRRNRRHPLPGPGSGRRNPRGGRLGPERRSGDGHGRDQGFRLWPGDGDDPGRWHGDLDQPGPRPPTATARDRDVLQSGTLEQGESYSQTFDTPGTYEYFCEFHAGMKGTIIVE